MQRRYAELILLAAGVGLLVKGGWDLGNYAAFQRHPDWYLGKTTAKYELPINFYPRNWLGNLADLLADLHVAGKLEVPRLGVSVLVVEGNDEQKLGLAAGHLSGSAGFGQIGNAVIAGHRDTSFWPLRKVKLGDRVRVRAGKTYEYVVSSISIVNPDHVSVLRSTDDRTLTQVTCYPFRYIGGAPKRFIVQATIPGS